MPFLFFFKKKYKGLEHYEKIRDKLTLREKEEIHKKAEFEYVPDITRIISMVVMTGIFFCIFFGVVQPIINDVIFSTEMNSTISGLLMSTTKTMMNIMPISFVVILIAGLLSSLAPKDTFEL